MQIGDGGVPAHGDYLFDLTVNKILTYNIQIIKRLPSEKGEGETSAICY